MAVPRPFRPTRLAALATALLPPVAGLVGHAHAQVPTPPGPPTALYSHGEPSDLEQYALSQLNRARRDPAAESYRIADHLFYTFPSSGIIVYDYYTFPQAQGIARDAFLAEFRGLPGPTARPPVAYRPQQPLALNPILQGAAHRAVAEKLAAFYGGVIYDPVTNTTTYPAVNTPDASDYARAAGYRTLDQTTYVSSRDGQTYLVPEATGTGVDQLFTDFYTAPGQPAPPPYVSLSEVRAADDYLVRVVGGRYDSASPQRARDLTLGAGRPAFATGTPVAGGGGGVLGLTSEAGVGAANHYGFLDAAGVPGILDLGRLDVFGGMGVFPNPLLFITGAVYEDADGDGQYSPGEGLAGVLVQPDRGYWSAVTSASGGYAIPLNAIVDVPVNRQVGPPLAAGGTLTLTFSGGLRAPVTRTVVLPGHSMEVDVLQERAAGRARPHLVATFGADTAVTTRAKAAGKVKTHLQGSLVVANDGAAKARGFKVVVFLSDDALDLTGARVLLETDVAKVKPGRAVTLPLDLELGGAATAGRVVVAAVDVKDSVPQLDRAGCRPVRPLP